MIELPHGCKRSELSVHPKNWKSKKAEVTKPWYINYRFYHADGTFKLVSTRGMNAYKTWAERKDATEVLLESITESLEAGYNPVLNEVKKPDGTKEIDGRSTLINALKHAATVLEEKVEHQTWIDINAVVRNVELHAPSAEHLTVGKTTRKHLIKILDDIGKYKKVHGKNKEWSGNNFNYHRKHLRMCFTELKHQEVIDTNPINEDFEIRKTVRKKRRVLEPDERIKVAEFLKSNYPEFWRFTRIFFNSGCRTAELMRLRGKQVRLNKQEFTVLVKKRNVWEEVDKVIPGNVLGYWEDAMRDCKHNDYVFSTGLKPGPVSINPRQITKRWREHVKDKLDIKADFYSLKHLHTDAVAAQSGLETAREVNSQLNQATTEIYAVGEADRIKTKLKRLHIDF